MTEEEEERLRDKCREVWKLSSEQIDYYIYLCKLTEKVQTTDFRAWEAEAKTEPKARTTPGAMTSACKRFRTHGGKIFAKYKQLIEDKQL